MAQEKVFEYWQIGLYGTNEKVKREWDNEFDAIERAIKTLHIMLKSAHSCPVNIVVWRTIAQTPRIAYIVNKDGVFAYQKPTIEQTV